MRSFNISGPCHADRHYMIPPERRFQACLELIEKQAYFVVHAPRQTGKTTTMQALARRLTAEGRYAALWFSCETGRAFADDVAAVSAAERSVWQAVQKEARAVLPASLQPPEIEEVAVGGFLQAQLSRWAAACPRPLVLVFDEIDALQGNPLRSVLSQLRAGYTSRPTPFPWSVTLCGMRDVRDYKAASGGGPIRLGSSSPFNIKEESLRFGSFTQAEIGELYAQHTAESGQPFTEDALAHAWELSQGQPWLVNALARQVVAKIRIPPPEPITAAHIEQARERLIAERSTHLDSLLARLQEEPVRKVLEPILAGEIPYADPLDDAYQYVTDLGLIAPDPPVRIANPIYREIIFRVLASGAERLLQATRPSALGEDGRIDVGRLLGGFADFWREHGEILAERMEYPEVAAQLVLMAYLHWIVNGGGFIDREVGIGRKRIDVLIRWPHAPHVDAGGQRAVQRIAMELKVWRDRDKKGDPLKKGLAQLDEYLARLGLDEGVLVIFDLRGAAAPVDDRTRFEEAETPSGRRVTVLRA